LGPKSIGVVLFGATRRRRSRDHSIPHRPFPTCIFRQFFGKTHRLAVNGYFTDDRQTDCSMYSYKASCARSG